MLELFSRDDALIKAFANDHIIPVQAPDDLSDLSAILLDEDYYSLAKTGKVEINGVSTLGYEQPSALALAEVIEELIEYISLSHTGIFSRLQLDVSNKPRDDKTPDILYALRVYLTGDDSAHAIRVTGVTDDE